MKSSNSLRVHSFLDRKLILVCTFNFSISSFGCKDKLTFLMEIIYKRGENNK